MALTTLEHLDWAGTKMNRLLNDLLLEDVENVVGALGCWLGRANCPGVCETIIEYCPKTYQTSQALQNALVTVFSNYWHVSIIGWNQIGRLPDGSVLVSEEMIAAAIAANTISCSNEIGCNDTLVHITLKLNDTE